MVLLLIHVFCAVFSLGLMGAACVGKVVRPAHDYEKLVRLSGTCFGALMITGVTLVVGLHTSVASACLSGFAYFVILGTLYACYKRLAAQI